MSKPRPLISAFRPTTAGSPPKSSFQAPCPNTTIRSPPGEETSPGPINRPKSAFVPSKEKQFSETTVPMPKRLSMRAEKPICASTPENAGDWVRMVSYSARSKLRFGLLVVVQYT